MSLCGKYVTTIAATIWVAAICRAQQPFDLDPSFVTSIGTQGVGSIALLEDGDVLLSGTIRFPGDQEDRNTARLNPDGSRDVDYPFGTYGGGKLVPWEGRFYVGNGQGIRRIWPNGSADNDFAGLNLDPYIYLLQGGDFHVFPDGRLLITGTHELSDTVRGYVGLYNLIWITAEGRLDTTRVHRKCNGGLDTVKELADGSFLIGGGMTQYDGYPVGNIIHVFADGSLDTSYHTSVIWNWPACFYPLPDGKVLCGGDLVFQGISDTLHLVRLNPDGSLDGTFNNLLDLERSYDQDGVAPVTSITPLGADRYIITGFWDRVEGNAQGGIALVDTAGNLLDDLFVGGGCGTYWDGFSTIGGINGLTEAPDGSYYIHGYYHGYDDGTTNGAMQRMVSRLYGLDVGVEEAGDVEAVDALKVYPNPAETWAALTFVVPNDQGRTELLVLDLTGRNVWSKQVSGQHGQLILDTKDFAAGNYTVELRSDGRMVAAERLVIKN